MIGGLHIAHTPSFILLLSRSINQDICHFLIILQLIFDDVKFVTKIGEGNVEGNGCGIYWIL